MLSILGEKKFPYAEISRETKGFTIILRLSGAAQAKLNLQLSF